MIDGSEKRTRQLAFELHNSHVCEKSSNTVTFGKTMQVCCPCWRSWSSRTSRWCASAIMVEIDETKDENDGWPKVTENQTNYVVATGINRPVTVTQYHLLRNNGCRKWQRHNENHGSRRMKHLFLVSRKIILQNHASRLLWKSRFTRKKLAISPFTGKKEGRSRVTKIPFTTLLIRQ